MMIIGQTITMELKIRRKRNAAESTEKAVSKDKKTSVKWKNWFNLTLEI